VVASAIAAVIDRIEVELASTLPSRGVSLRPMAVEVARWHAPDHCVGHLRTQSFHIAQWLARIVNACWPRKAQGATRSQRGWPCFARGQFSAPSIADLDQGCSAGCRGMVDARRIMAAARLERASR